MIICPSRKPRSTVRGPTRSLNENVLAGRDDRAVDVLGHQLHVVDAVRRRGAHVGREAWRSARGSRAASPRPSSGRRGSASGAARRGGPTTPRRPRSSPRSTRPSGARPGLDGRIRTRFPVHDEARVDRALPPVDEERLDGLRDPVRRERDAEAVAGRAEANELRRGAAAASEPTSSPLKESAIGSATSFLASATASSAALVVSSGSTWVSAGDERSRAGERGLLQRGEQLRGSIASPGRDGITENSPRRVTTCARRGFGSVGREALGELLGAGTRHEHRVDEQRRRARVDERADAAEERVVTGADERCLRRGGVDHQRLAGTDVVGLPADAKRRPAGPDRRGAAATPGSGHSQ